MQTKGSGLFFRLSHLGIKPEHNPAFAKRIILTNLLGFLFSANMAFSSLVFAYFGYSELAWFTAFFVLTELCWPLLNLLGHHKISRLGMLVTSNLLGFCVSIVLTGTGYNRGFFVMAGLPILLFSLKEKKSIALGFLLPLILYPLSEWLQYHLPASLVIGLSNQAAELIHHGIGAVYITLVFLMFLFLSRENARSEEQLEIQRARSFSSAKFAALGEMASGIAHEINNPMTVINLNSQNLKFYLDSADFKKEVAQQKLEVISRTVHRIARIIESMRIFAREGRNDPFKIEPVRNIVEDTLTFCAERFKHHQIKLDVQIADGLNLNCRSVQISQVFLNLLNNAFDAIEEMPIKWIKLTAAKTGKQVQIVITDSGNGIAEQERDKIFQPFYTTKTAGKGTGLGLSLSRKIIEDHGGTLELDSSSAHTSFIIRIG